MTMNDYSVNVYLMNDSVNVPKYINGILRSLYEDKKKYAFFIQDDIFSNIRIDVKEFLDKYVEFMKKWELPYMLYPYYIHINSVLPAQKNIPNPALEISINGSDFNILNAPAYGFLAVDIQKFKKLNFAFKEEYPHMFYLQDMFDQFYAAKMTLSNCCYMDIKDSWKLFKTHTTAGYHVDVKKFGEEKAKYYETEHDFVSIDDFVTKIREKYSKNTTSPALPLVDITLKD